jgi:hypothetical protein
LIYQVAWLREFRLVFGGSTAASGAVLAIFMGGLGLGNALIGRRVDWSTNPLRLYAVLELLIGASVAASPFLIDAVRTCYIAMGGRSAMGLAGASVTRLLLSSVVLAVPTLAMGGTLPAAARVVTLAGDRARRSVGIVYGANTMGAVLGAAISTFVLLERLGTRGTLWVACAANLLIALVAWRVSRLAGTEETQPHRGDPAD